MSTDCFVYFGEPMARPSKLSSMSVKTLFKLRDDVAKALKDKAADLQKQLAALTGSAPQRGRPAKGKSRKGRKVAAQFRSKKDPAMTWSGRGATPRWMKAEMKGTKLTKESFRIK
jgi:DNA-binding protein H-NS